MPRLPRPSGEEMVRFLAKQGYVVTRVRGSHHIMRRGVLQTVVPVHGREALRTGTLSAILREVHLSAPEFARLWREE